MKRQFGSLLFQSKTEPFIHCYPSTTITFTVWWHLMSKFHHQPSLWNRKFCPAQIPNAAKMKRISSWKQHKGARCLRKFLANEAWWWILSVWRNHALRYWESTENGNSELKQTTTTTATRTSKTKGLMRKTIAVHVRYKSLYISLPSSAKRLREMTKFCVVWGTRTTTPGWILPFPFDIERNHYIFRLSTFLEPLAYRTDLDNREFC